MVASTKNDSPRCKGVWRPLILIVCTLQALHVSSALAQPGVPPPRPSDQQLQPDWRPSQQVLPEITLEPQTEFPAGGQLAIELRAVDFVGNTIVSTDRLAEIATPFVGRSVNAGELENLRRLLSLEYAQRGYINSGAVFPDQDLRDGVLVVQLIEGQLNQIEVSGTNRLPESLIAEPLQTLTDMPLNVMVLEQQLQVLQQDQRIERMRAELRPGSLAGDAELLINVTEARPWRTGLSLENDFSPSVGEHRLLGTFEHLNLTGRADELAVELGLTEGSESAEIRYNVPTIGDLRLHLGFHYSEGDVVEDPFDDLDIESRNRTWRLGLSKPFITAPNKSFAGYFYIDRRDSRDRLLDEPFSFSAGARDGESKVTAVRAQLDYKWRNARTALGLRSIVSLGVDAFGATVNSGRLPDGKFLAWLGQAVTAYRHDNGAEIIAKAVLQWTEDKLLSMEQFAYGGPYSVRGYRHNRLVRDMGAVGSVEFRWPILRDLEGIGQAQVAAFVDYGWGQNRDGQTPRTRRLAGAGLGLRWQWRDQFEGHLYWAKDLKSLEEPDHESWQDRGVYFRFSYQPKL